MTRSLCCLLLLWASFCLCSAQALPSRLTFLSSSAFAVTIETPTFDPPNQDPNGPLSGHGIYTISVAGKPVFTGANFPFDGILADATGQVKTNQAGYAIKSDINWRNAFGSGCDLTIPAGSNIVVSLTGLKISGNATVTLPYRSDGGTRATASLTNFTLTASTAGAVVVDSGMSLTKGPKLKLGGFAVGIGSNQSNNVNAHLTIAYPPVAASKNHLLLVIISNATLDTPLPGLSTAGGGLATSSPLELTATNVTIDEAGVPSADQVGLDEGALQANLDASPAPSQEIDLLQPTNFGMRPTSVQASLAGGTISFKSLGFDLELPTSVNDGAGGRVIIPGLMLDSTGKVTVPKLPNPVKAIWQTDDAFGQIILNLSGFSFSTTKGLTNVTGSVQLDPKGPLSGASGPITFGLQDFSFDQGGACGTVSLSSPGGAKAWGIPVTLNEGSLSFDEGNVVGADIAATDNNFHFGLRIGASSSGAISIGVESGDYNPVGWGPLLLHITGGSGTVDSSGLSTLVVSGSITVTAKGSGVLTDDMTMDFKDLGMQNGQMVANSFHIAKPVNVDVGPVSLNLTEVTVQNTPLQFKLTGDVKFPDIFGGSGKVTFKGLDIATAPFKVSIDGIGVDAAIPGLGSFGATFDPGAGNFNGFTNPFVGHASVQIEGLPGFDTNILVSKEAWLLSLEVSIPPIPIPIPPTQPPFLYVLGLNGALGYGIGVLPGDNKVGESDEQVFRNYQAVPGNFLIQAGIDVGTVDQYLMWGNLTFSGGFPAVQLDLRGDVYVLQDRATSRNNPDPTRKGYLELVYQAPDSFFAHGNLDITLIKDLPIYHLTGTLEAQMTPTNGFVYAGYPVDPNGYGFDFLGVGAKSGFGIDLWPAHGIHFGMLQYADLFGFLDLKRGFDIGATLNVGNTPSLNSTGDFYAEGDIDFGIISAFARAEAGWNFGLPEGPISAKARFEAGIHTFLGDETIDTGEIDLLGK